MMQTLQNKDELKVITVEEIKQYESLSNLTNEEALQIIDIVKQLAFITHNIIAKDEPRTISKICETKQKKACK